MKINVKVLVKKNIFKYRNQENFLLYFKTLIKIFLNEILYFDN